MKVTENYSGTSPEKLFSLAARENNARRGGLIVNYLQAKHIPARPSETIALFDKLADRVNREINENNTVVIGFAETATAIGAELAARLSEGRRCTYIHTTREHYPEKYRLALFSEEHSHASEQKLYSDKGLDIFDGAERIIFAEDELTTGKTVLNFISALKGKVSCKFSAASIINGMSAEDIEKYASLNISLHYLVKLDSSAEALKKGISVTSCEDMEFDLSSIPDELTLRTDSANDPRLGINGSEYKRYCESLAKTAFEKMKPYLTQSSVDVIGTEECMYPAVKLGELLEKQGYDVRCHATTRSPIIPSEAEGYPLFARYRVKSPYDESRRTFIYNLYECGHRIAVIG